jgi:hypothetical protein
MRTGGIAMTFSRGLALKKNTKNTHTHKNRDIATKINNQPIQTVKTTTFLGMTLDTQLTWKKHLEKLTDSSRGLFNIMRYVRGNGWGASTKILILLYKAFIRGKIDYASVVYDSSAITNKKKIGVIQNKALVTIAGAGKCTSTEALEVALGIMH